MPWYTQRGQPVSISSLLRLYCPKSLLTRIQWTVVACRPVCSFPIQFNASSTILSELFLPPRSLDYGLYQMTLTVGMQVLPILTSSVSTYLYVTPSPITVNLVQYGSSMITIGRNQNFTLNPGSFSIDPDQVRFNRENWNYVYYCRINQSLCFANLSSNGSSWIIPPGLLQPDQTYQFRVDLIDIFNSTRLFTGYLLVQVQENDTTPISVQCVISELCPPTDQYHLLNPKAQLVLSSSSNSRSFAGSISWNIYRDSDNWTLVSNLSAFDNQWFYGE